MKEPDMPPHPLPPRNIGFAALASSAIVLVSLGAPSRALAQAAEGPSFTAEQVERGRTAYNQNCQECHGSTLDNGEFGGPPLKGSYFARHWTGGNVAALVAFMQVKMPPDRPGQLNAETYADITAFILGENGYPPGSKELPADATAQQAMSLAK